MKITKAQTLEYSMVAISLAGIATWLLARLISVRPAILGDEWVYTMSSRHSEQWGLIPDPLGNYLFNLVYRSTHLCGPSFYTCGKVLNLLFFIGFLITLYAISRKFTNHWIALIAVIATGLSPISVYVSMYLPETLYFFLLSLSVFFLASAIEKDKAVFWGIAGATLGLAALTKPHALISLIAFAIFVLVFRPNPNSPSLFFRRIGSSIAGFLLGRFLVGFLVSGPKSLLILNSYGLGDIASRTITPSATQESTEISSPFDGVVSLFPNQLSIHVQASSALVGASIALLMVNLLMILFRGSSNRKAVNSFALLILIWLGVMTVAIVSFTGWITGSGDDHTLRVLLRYYDFIFPLVFIASLGIALKLREENPSIWMRWLPALLILFAGSAAFTGAFAQLTIQIADAPNLAGLVVDRFVFDLVALSLVLLLGLLAFFPRYLGFVLPSITLVSFVMTGFQAQEQYRNFRGQDSSADLAGKAIYERYDRKTREDILIVSTTRFDARVASLWMDTDNPILLVNPGSVVPESAIGGHTGVLVLGDVITEGDEYLQVSTESGYVLSLSEGQK